MRVTSEVKPQNENKPVTGCDRDYISTDKIGKGNPVKLVELNLFTCLFLCKEDGNKRAGWGLLYYPLYPSAVELASTLPPIRLTLSSLLVLSV